MSCAWLYVDFVESQTWGVHILGPTLQKVDGKAVFWTRALFMFGQSSSLVVLFSFFARCLLHLSFALNSNDCLIHVSKCFWRQYCFLVYSSEYPFGVQVCCQGYFAYFVFIYCWDKSQVYLKLILILDWHMWNTTYRKGIPCFTDSKTFLTF